MTARIRAAARLLTVDRCPRGPFAPRSTESGSRSILNQAHLCGFAPCRAQIYDSALTCGFSVVSVGDLIFVDEAAEDGSAVDSALGEVDWVWRSGFGLSGGELSDAAVGPGGVVVRQVLGECSAQVLFVDDEGSVEEFAA